MGEGGMKATRDSEPEVARAQAFCGFCPSATLRGCKPQNARNVAGENKRKRYAKHLLTPAESFSPFTPPRRSAAPAPQPKLRERWRG